MINIISSSLQMITVEVTWPSIQSKFFISAVYASNVDEERNFLWSEITDLATSHGLDDKPWLILGDFNQIRSPTEHSKPASLNFDKRMRDFNQCLQSANLDDLNFRGNMFTWWNKRKNDPIAKKLDRSLVNEGWYFEFPSSVTYFGIPEFSDHVVISITLDPSTVKTKKPFRFYNFTTQSPVFLDMICNSWFSFNVTGSAMFRVSRKLKLLKKTIKDFSKQNYSGIEKRTALALEKLLERQNLMLASPSTTNAELELKAMQEWEELSNAETAFFFQRSRINWLAYGDGSSRLFHRYAASRQALNHIHYLVNENGERIDSPPEILNQCVLYFSDILGGQSSPPMFIQSDLDLLFDFKCSEDQVNKFEKGFSDLEVKDVFFSLPKKQNRWSGWLFI